MNTLSVITVGLVVTGGISALALFLAGMLWFKPSRAAQVRIVEQVSTEDRRFERYLAVDLPYHRTVLQTVEQLFALLEYARLAGFVPADIDLPYPEPPPPPPDIPSD